MVMGGLAAVACAREFLCLGSGSSPYCVMAVAVRLQLPPLADRHKEM